MNIKKTILAGVAALGALVASAALAGGIYTVNFPQVTAANIASTFQLPVDTQYARGQAPQTAYVTAGDLKTYSNGGAIVTASATAGAATANGERVVVTSEALVTANAAAYTLTLTDSSVTAASLPLCNVGNGTNTTAGSTLATVTPGAGSLVIVVYNRSGAAALNGTLVISCRISS
jgi:hypothetical protein